ncbi:HAMP domain-containing protein, partial [Jiella sp. M17.18]|uniref:HAMP domain-containing protein n=1 Tax=Jiella sp. M17.18 TaxID=3234247 RepID=UPI0034E04E4C
MSLTNLKISRKLAATFAVMILVVLAMGGVVYSHLASIGTANGDMRYHSSVMSSTTDIRMAVSRMEAAMRAFMLTKNDRYTKAIEVRQTSINKELSNLRAVAPDQAAKIDQIAETIANWRKVVVDPIIAGVRSPYGFSRALTLFQSADADKAIGAAEDAIDAVRLAETQAVLAGSDRQMEATQTATLALVAGIAVLILLTGGLGWLLARAIARPIDRMTAAMRRLASGDKAVTVPGIGRGDEIGEMAGAVQVFKEQAIERDRLAEEAEAARISQDQAKQRQAALDNAKAEDLRAFVGMVEVGFDRLSAGDLTVRMAG